jgi:hypothetical protein
MNGLVNYSSSDDGSETEVEINDISKAAVPGCKRKVQLPMLLPSETKKARIVDQPEHHQNRVRSIPHTEGNWASHVYIECDYHLEFI